jgi:hypothetical protein
MNIIICPSFEFSYASLNISEDYVPGRKYYFISMTDIYIAQLGVDPGF